MWPRTFFFLKAPHEKTTIKDFFDWIKYFLKFSNNKNFLELEI
jgi:hypothetical protein